MTTPHQHVTEQSLSENLGHKLLEQQLVLTTAESCTGGGIAATVTDTAGSSAWFDRAFITYTNQAKQEMVDVSGQTLEQYGAVSEPVVIQMVQGALAHSQANIGVSVSGIAGPGGGSADKPVGTVCFAWASKSGWQRVETQHFSGDRAQVRSQTIQHALQTIYDYLCAEA